MNVVIIEDEKPAAEKLRKALHRANGSIVVAASLSSVRDAVTWFDTNGLPDLVFMDIELNDGLSFRIFDETEIRCPVIFITAFDDYWQEAFERNGIDYLLKPVQQAKLETALEKYQSLQQFFVRNYRELASWDGQHNQAPGIRRRFLVRKGTEYVSIKAEDIAYFYAIQKLICLVDNQGNRFILDQSLSEAEKSVDHAQFYRVNRKYLVNMNAIRRIRACAKSKLQLEIEPAVDEDIIISQENTAAFKEWMGGR